MRKRFWTVTLITACAALGAAWVLAGPPVATAKEKTDAVFGLTKVWQLHLDVSAKEWEALQPIGGMGFPGGPGGPGGRPAGPGQPPQPAEKPAEKPGDKPAEPPDRHRGVFGMEFPWAHAALTAEGKTYKDVGIRYKGNFSYMMSARSLRRNLKIDFDHFDSDQRFHGLKKINLNAGAADPTRLREALGFAVFRAAGVPAPRTAFVEATLTVPGKYDKEYVGLYTLIEQVDRTFLKEHFKSNKGLLMKPERVRGLEYLGEDWDQYKSRYQPKHDATKKQARRVIEFVRLINKGSDEQFRNEIGSYLDVDEFLRFVAGNALVANLDSFFTMGHNYYLYLNPETNKFVFIPWDLDLSFAGFPMSGTPEQQMNLSLTHPYPGENKLTDRLLAMKEVRQQYLKLLKELSAGSFTKERLLKDLDAMEKTTKDVLAREKKAAAARKEGSSSGPGFPGMMGRGTDLRTFATKRTESVVAQLDGKSKGYVPVMGFGPGGPGGRPGGRPGGFGPGNFLAKPLLEALDGDKDGKVTKDELVAGVKKFFKECDKDKKGSLDEKTLAEGLNRIFPRPPGFGPPGAPPGPGGPGGPGRPPGPGGPPGFGPGMFLAPVLVKRADTNKDGKVTLDEMVAAAEALFKECDKDKKGALGEKELAAGINLLFQPPPGFGPPGPRPDAPKPDAPKPDAPKKEGPKEEQK